MGGHEALLLVAPFEEWEVDNPETFKPVLVHKTEATPHLKTQGAELHACLVGVVA